MTLAYIYIRYSTEMQEDGSSEQRQMEAATEYLRRNPSLQLAPKIYKDLGVSAYKGRNATQGALGEFVSDVRKGVVPKGSSLLLYAFNRFSRQNPFRTNKLLLDIIDLGIRLVTTENGTVFDLDTIEKAALGPSVETWIKMTLANQESADKSRLVKIGWDKKRERGEILTSKAPSWLRLVEHPTDPKQNYWDLVPEKVKLVQRVFQLAFNGNGALKIAQILNDELQPVISFNAERYAALNRKRAERGLEAKLPPAWGPSSVRAILTNEAVFGRYKQKSGGSAVIDGYYLPKSGQPIVTKEQFDRVQAAMKLRDSGGGARIEGKVPNLFKSISYCLYCKRRLKYQPTRKDYAYLVCLHAASGADHYCKGMRFPYKEAEAAVLDRLINKQARDLSNDMFEDHDSKRDLLLAEIAKLKERHKRVRNMALDSGSDETDPLWTDELKRIQTLIRAKEQEVRELERPALTREEVEESVELFRQHEELKKNNPNGSPELNELRLRMHTAILRQIQRIEFGAMLQSSDAGREFLEKVGGLEAFAVGKMAAFKERLLPKQEYLAKRAISERTEMLIQITYVSKNNTQRLIDADPFVSDASKLERGKRMPQMARAGGRTRRR